MSPLSHRRSRLVLFCLFVTGAVQGFALGELEAQASPTAAEVAAQVQAFYDRTRSLNASFHQTYYHKLYDRYDRSKGQVIFKKPGKMRWNYARPNGKVIVSNGRILQVYEPGDGSEPGQMFERSIEQHQLPGAFSFLLGTGKLADDFNFRLLDAARHGFTQGYVLELRPREPSPHYQRIIFYVDKNPARAGVVHRVLIIDASGNRNRFDFREMRFNREVRDSSFNFRPPPRTRRVRP